MSSCPALQDFDCSCPRCCEFWDRSRGVRCQCGHIRFLDVAGAKGGAGSSRRITTWSQCSEMPLDWEPYNFTGYKIAHQMPVHMILLTFRL